MTQPASPAKDPLTEAGPWNAVAAGYDEEIFERMPELVTRALAIVQPTPAMKLLDVGTGPGTFAVRAAPLVNQLTAIDFAQNMIERLRAHVARAGLRNVEALVMDGQALALPDDSFDAVVSIAGWFLFEDRARGLSEMRRVLRHGGRVLVSSWNTPDRNTVLGAGLGALREAMPQLPRPSGALPTQQPEILAGELRAAGLRDVQTEVLDVPVEFESVDVYFRLHERAGAPFVVLRAKLGDEAFDAACARAKALLAQRFGAGPVKLQCSAIFAHGVRD